MVASWFRKFSYNAPHRYTDEKTESIRHWRRNIGHSGSNVDPVSEQSLAARVCASDDGLSQAFSQAGLYTAIVDYAKIGPVLGTLCCLAW